jgi:hypothetical protein
MNASMGRSQNLMSVWKQDQTKNTRGGKENFLFSASIFFRPFKI